MIDLMKPKEEPIPEVKPKKEPVVLTGGFAALAARKKAALQKPKVEEKPAPTEEYDDEEDSD